MTEDVKTRGKGGGSNKARKGVALVLALMVVLIGGVIIGLTFDFVFGFSWISTEQRRTYVDHTTALSFIQAKIGQIIEHNISKGETMHVKALSNAVDGERAQTSISKDLTLEKLSFGKPWSEDIRDKEMLSGTGLGRVVTDVFDMHFKPEWVDYESFKSPDVVKHFPSVFNMGGDAAGGMGKDGEGKSGSASSGVSDGDEGLNPDTYGAYLIRVRLYDHRGKLLRTAEEVFVQTLK
ncbi:MAG: hypothetical protein LBP21_04670 [Synergistaceae bacterium]|nr:hypothetical protein [Synergistaceae bacterium]